MTQPAFSSRAPSGRRPSPIRATRRGGILVIVALSLTVLAAFAALVFDLGYLHAETTRLQMAADAAAQAAARDLDGTEDGLEAARSTAVAVASLSTIAGAPLVLDSGDISFGRYDADDGFRDETDAASVNALKISTRAELPLFFGALAFGDTGDAVASRSAFVSTSEATGASAVDCWLPPVVPLCAIDDEVQDRVFDAGMYATQSGADRGEAIQQAWLVFSNKYFSHSAADCEAAGAVEIGDKVELFPYFMGTHGVNAVRYMGSSGTRWDEDLWGEAPDKLPRSHLKTATVERTLEGPGLVVDGTGLCTQTGSFTQIKAQVVGFIWVALYDSNSGQGSPMCGLGSASERAACGRMRFRVDVTGRYDYGTDGDGPDYGVVERGDLRFLAPP